MSGLAWATVGEMEPRVHQLEQSIEHGVPGKLLKIEACLGPAIQKAEELEKVFQAQVGVCVCVCVCALLEEKKKSSSCCSQPTSLIACATQ